MPRANLVFGMGVLTVSGVVVWAGITNPEGGVFAGLRAALSGQPVTPARSAVSEAVRNSYAKPGEAGFIGPTAAPARGPAGPVAGKRGKVIAEARTWLGVPYVWGGNTRQGVDCSGFTKAVYATVGVELPRVSFAQATTGTKTTAAKATPGDLVAFGTPVHHVGIYLGGGQMIHAPNSRGSVRVEKIWNTEPVFYRKLLP